VKGGVEAGDSGHFGERHRDKVDRVERGWLMQRCQVRQGAQRGDDIVVQQHRGGEGGAAVDDAMPDGVDGTELAERRLQCVSAHTGRGREIGGTEEPVVLTDDPQLETRRADVDNKNSHPGQ
jgi:hypothetical protein